MIEFVAHGKEKFKDWALLKIKKAFEHVLTLRYNYLDSTHRVVPPQQRCLNHSFFLHNVVSDYYKSCIVSLYHARTVCHIESSYSIAITYRSLRIKKRPFEENAGHLSQRRKEVIFEFVDSLRISIYLHVLYSIF